MLGIDAKALKSAAKLDAAESALAAPFMGFGDTLFYPDPAQRAAIVCSRIVRNHPLPDGNKRTGYICMLLQLEQAGLTFTHPEGDQDETADVIEALAASELSEEAFVEWVKGLTQEAPTEPEPSPYSKSLRPAEAGLAPSHRSDWGDGKKLAGIAGHPECGSGKQLPKVPSARSRISGQPAREG